MEHAIDNKEIGVMVYSKLTSHDWAHHPRLSAPKESSAIELRGNGVVYSRSGPVSLAARNGIPNTTIDGGSTWRTMTRDIRRRNAV